ncbi:hypothetical protein MSKU15_1586 [Komagataeibacter diospyri]|nr:hypothetical protein MSKU15_1586 [Komagataeibacter diospyri]
MIHVRRKSFHGFPGAAERLMLSYWRRYLYVPNRSAIGLLRRSLRSGRGAGRVCRIMWCQGTKKAGA